MPDARFLREMYGVSALPRLLNPDELHASIQHHYPPALLERGRAANVLLSLAIDDAGGLERADAIEPPTVPGSVVGAVLINDRGGEPRDTESPATDPVLMRAAEAAVQVCRFTPARRNGHPVPLAGFRVTIRFAPPEPSARPIR